MCVLNDRLIRRWAEYGGLTPFDPNCINPASVDLRWSGKVRASKRVSLMKDGWSSVFDFDVLTLPANGHTASAQFGGYENLYLLDTIETVTLPNHLCGFLYLKSSIGRQGLEHLHAGFFDPGFSGTATLEIVNTAPWPVTITRGQRLVQLVLEQMAEVPMKSYQDTGRYNGQNSPQPARGDK